MDDHSTQINRQLTRVTVSGLSDSPIHPQSALHGRAALVVAHPGHELCVHGWLESARPMVFVLTDGSGHAGKSRLSSTTRLLSAAGAKQGSIYGRFPDAAIYAAILNHDFRFFINLAIELSEAFVREQIEYVAGDAIEGYNPVHDVCRLVTDAAVEIMHLARGRRPASYDFLTVSPPDDCPESLRDRAIWLHLDDSSLERKLAAARAYAEIAGEVNTALGEMGTEAFRVECLRPVESSCRPGDEAWRDPWVNQPPWYERHGERRVADGYYRRVLRYREHVRPLEEALRRYVKTSVDRLVVPQQPPDADATAAT